MKVLSMRGVPVDMSRLIAQNEKAPALGNAKMNARGDIIGRNGEVVKKRETIVQEYYASPKAVKQVALRDISTEVFQTPAQAVEAITKTAENKKATTADPADAKASTVAPAAQRKRKIEDRED